MHRDCRREPDNFFPAGLFLLNLTQICDKINKESNLAARRRAPKGPEGEKNEKVHCRMLRHDDARGARLRDRHAGRLRRGRGRRIYPYRSRVRTCDRRFRILHRKHFRMPRQPRCLSRRADQRRHHAQGFLLLPRRAVRRSSCGFRSACAHLQARRSDRHDRRVRFERTRRSRRQRLRRPDR